MTLLENKLVDFFNTHPEATVVFVALGVLFTDLEKANGYCGGVSGSSAKTFTRQEVEDLAAAEADAEITENNVGTIADAPVEDAPVVDAPVVDAPVVDAPVDDTPVVDAPVEDAPVVDAPVEDTPVVDAPEEDAPVVDAPVDDAPVDDAPVVDAPADDNIDAEIKDDETVVNELTDALDKSKKKLDNDKKKRR